MTKSGSKLNYSIVPKYKILSEPPYFKMDISILNPLFWNIVDSFF